MQPDAESDTRSPWYEAFAQHTRPPVAGVRWIVAAADDVLDGAARPETGEPEWPTEALFDCYNG